MLTAIMVLSKIHKEKLHSVCVILAGPKRYYVAFVNCCYFYLNHSNKPIYSRHLILEQSQDTALIRLAASYIYGA